MKENYIRTNEMRSVLQAKRRCRLNMEHLRMAKEMGLNPWSLIENISSPSEPWKTLVKQWIREMYERRQTKIARKEKPGE